jgi:hypothetical protein
VEFCWGWLSRPVNGWSGNNQRGSNIEELVSLVMKKTGSSKETAQHVVRIVIDFLKKLPLGSEQPSMVS